MKKLIVFALLAFTISSCSYDYNMTIYQNKNIRKFSKAKRVRNHTNRYVRPGKRGYIQDNTVTKNTRRTIRRTINSDRRTVSSY